MTAESGQIDKTPASGAEAGPLHAHAPSRAHVTPPPLAPALERANPRELQLFVVVAILVTAGLSFLLGELGIDVGVVPDAAFSEGECLSSTDVAIRTPNGVRWFSWIELSVRDKASDAVSHRAIARDITARKRAETALITARERAEFASQA